MSKTKQPVRNLDGKLICELVYEDGRWNILIKNKNCLTHISLSADGAYKLTDYTVKKK